MDILLQALSYRLHRHHVRRRMDETLCRHLARVLPDIHRVGNPTQPRLLSRRESNRRAVEHEQARLARADLRRGRGVHVPNRAGDAPAADKANTRANADLLRILPEAHLAHVDSLAQEPWLEHRPDRLAWPARRRRLRREKRRLADGLQHILADEQHEQPRPHLRTAIQVRPHVPKKELVAASIRLADDVPEEFRVAHEGDARVRFDDANESSRAKHGAHVGHI
mmetsp:Transcript_99272/g.284003  ORF Transcript_99272/g.284003 Transcript_99272/m.284003 type:complete len:224 (+) Transcript_99272:2627-3298(+)